MQLPIYFGVGSVNLMQNILEQKTVQPTKTQPAIYHLSTAKTFSLLILSCLYQLNLK